MKVVFASLLALFIGTPALADAEKTAADSTPGAEAPNSSAESTPKPIAAPPAPPPQSGSRRAGEREALVFAGVQLGILLPLGVDGALMLTKDAHPEWDIDVSWEPSNYWQSYSVAGAYHPLANAFFVGSRVRLLQLHAPWSRGYDAELDRQLGLGPEVGLRGWLDKGQRWLGLVSVGAIYVASDNTSLPLLYTLNVGLSYRVFKH